METMKKFKVYLFIFLGFFILSTILTSFLMRDDYKNINYEIKSETSNILVTECKAANTNGYIKGSVTNNTEELIPLKYLQINLYDENDVYLGSEYKELKNFYPKETVNFDMSYEYLNIDKVTLIFIDKIPEKEAFNLFEGIDDETMSLAAPVGGTLVLSTFLAIL
ncbi:MAG: hypothetical protein IJE59_03370 [Clostridia bacterium]|nr:hypothetical protein [Clostridia bacterium]